MSIEECVIQMCGKIYVGRFVDGKVYAFNAALDPSNPDDVKYAQIMIDPTTGKESFAGIFDGKSIVPLIPDCTCEEVAEEFFEDEPEEVSVDVAEMTDLDLKCPYLESALEFAKNSDSATIGLDADLTKLMKLTTSGFITKCKSKFMISSDELIRIMVRNMLWTKSPGIDDMCLPFMIKYNMYEEFQNAVFSKLDRKSSIELYNKYKFDVEFMAAYPFLNADHETFLDIMLDIVSGIDPAKAVLLIIHGVTVSNVATSGHTALTQACMNAKVTVALAILETESQGLPGHVGPEGKTALMYAIEHRLIDVVNVIIATGKANLSHVSPCGKTALMHACCRNIKIADAILAADDSNIDYVNPDDGNTALIYACTYKLESIALKIIRRGKGKPEHSNKKGLTALLVSCWKSLSNVAIAIIATGNANVDQISIGSGNTALIWACKNSCPLIAGAILATGSGLPKHTNKYGKTALGIASKKGMTDICTLLENM